MYIGVPEFRRFCPDEQEAFLAWLADILGRDVAGALVVDVEVVDDAVRVTRFVTARRSATISEAYPLKAPPPITDASFP